MDNYSHDAGAMSFAFFLANIFENIPAREGCLFSEGNIQSISPYLLYAFTYPEKISDTFLRSRRSVLKELYLGIQWHKSGFFHHHPLFLSRDVNKTPSLKTPFQLIATATNIVIPSLASLSDLVFDDEIEIYWNDYDEGSSFGSRGILIYDLYERLLLCNSCL